MMTDEELAAIRARVDAATPGPWRCWNGYELRVPHVEQPVVPDMAMSRIGPESHLGVGLSSVRACDDMRALRPDAEFIAHAREDVPALLAEVERLRKRLERAEDRIEALKSENTNLCELNDAQLFAAAQTIKETRERVAALEAVRDAASANVQRLLERDAAMRAIVERVADMAVDGILCECAYRDPHPTGHLPECIVTAARALLAAGEGEAKE